MSGQPFRARFGFDADNRKLIELADPTDATDGVNLQTLKREAGFHTVARMGNLPSPSDPDPKKRPVPGRGYLVKFDLSGNLQDRIAVWDPTLSTTGGVGAVDVIEPAADGAVIAAAAGTDDPGKPITAGKGVGGVMDLTANADGSITATITTPGTGYAIGDSMIVPAASLGWPGMTGDTTIQVTALTGASSTGGWRFIDPHIWTKPLRTDPDPPAGAQTGDLSATTELNHEELKVWTGTTWHTLTSTDAIKGWIAALNLFQGTAQQVGGTVVGAITLDNLPDITNPTIGAGEASHYWVWTGTAGYVIKPADPNGVGADLSTALLQVGDWLQVSARPGTGGAATTYHWSHISGDLLARSRADLLFGLNGWVAGNYERGSLVTFQGSIYRASRDVLNTDGDPTTTGAPWTLVPLNAGVRNVPTDGDLPATAPGGDVYLVLSSAIAGSKPGLFSYDAGTNQWVQLGGGGAALDLTAGVELVSIGVPIGSIQMWPARTAPAGWKICDGSAFATADFPELQAVLGSNNIPDLRGCFVRGAGQHGVHPTWGFATRYPLTEEGFRTAMPFKEFKIASAGLHGHAYDTIHPQNLATGWTVSNGYGFPGYTGGGQVRNTQPASTDTSHAIHGNGEHTHTITGGDRETVPVNIALNYIIKCADTAVRAHI